ncbi:hypothetical protein NP493_701g01000 [Ridgeia piscesae]|uniref:Protein RRP5 homolog n=1 Tax=Ridgeia piscesae TaxID=27915 RepID=A0AAD9KSE5_RIDPI|nr:hypothetical protein NP493_701g01000 [Ridgeia piscesae]
MVVKEEENFPRGGPVAVATKRHARSVEEPDLFKSHEQSQPKKKKILTRVEKRTKKVKKEQKKDKDRSYKTNFNRITKLTPKELTEGMLILGCVQRISDYSIGVSLPYGMSASVPITFISDAYTAMLQKLTQGDADQHDAPDEEVGSLAELFRLGAPVRCRVMDTGGVGSSKRRLKLSMNPRDVNQNISKSSLMSGMVLSGSVASREDHGYVVDLGVKGISAFLKNKEAEEYIVEYNEGQPLKVGTYLHCLVKTSQKVAMLAGEGRTVGVVIDPKKVYRSLVTDTMGLTLQNLLPGMCVNATVTKRADNGVNVKVLSYKGCIHKSHMDLDDNDTVKAAILFVHPTSKAIALTQLTHLVTPDLSPRKQFGDLAIGDIIEKAEVIRVEKTRGVYFKLGDRVTAFARLSELADKTPQKVGPEFQKGTFHRCRIRWFDYADNLTDVTLKESVLKQQFMKLADLKPGMKVEGTVRGVHKFGVSVHITSHLRGFIPLIHLADVPLHHPEKMYKVDMKVKCRVLTVDPSKSSLILTAKKSLVSSKLPIITSYNDCERDIECEGFIANISDKGVLVVFYGNVKGWVSKHDLSAETIDYPEKVFYRGQVVKCRVIKNRREDGKLKLSFRMSGKTPFGKKEVEVPEDYAVGKSVDCKIIKKSSSGFDVELVPSKMLALLPKMHLSDHLGICDLLWDAHEEGDVIEGAVYISRTNVITVTKKLSLVEAAKNDCLVTDFDDLSAGLLLPGVIKKFLSYGAFIDILGGVVGLSPNRFMCDIKLPNPSAHFKVGQAVVAKVTDVDHEKRRFLLSLRLSECQDVDWAVNGLRLLEEYIKEAAYITERMKQRDDRCKLAEWNVGELVSVTVTQVTDHGALCQLKDSDVKGFVTQTHMRDARCSVGDDLPAIVLYADFRASCLELSINPELVKAVKHLKKNKFTQSKEGQTVKSEVQLIKDEFVLVSLKGHLAGQFAYVPVRQHLNDIIAKQQFVIGQVNQVFVKSFVDGHIVANLWIHEKLTNPALTSPRLAAPDTRTLKLGMTVKAIITAVLENQLNVKIGQRVGRVHVTEVVDSLSQEGDAPLAGYEVQQQVTVKVIGFRESKPNRYCPVSRSKPGSMLVECSLRPSALAVDGQMKERTFSVGNQVLAYVNNYVPHSHCLWVNVTPTVRGKVYGLNLSQHLQVLKKAESHFQPGNGYTATVISVNDDKTLELSLTEPGSQLKEGAVVNGIVHSLVPGKGAVINLAHGKRGMLSVTNFSDNYDNADDALSVGDYIKCSVVRSASDEKGYCVLSCRQSRLEKGKRSKVKDRDIASLADLHKGDNVRGFVLKSSNMVFVTLSADIVGRVTVEKVSKFYLEDVSVYFPPGKLVTAHILSIDNDTNRVDLSLLQKHTGIPECIPADKQATLPKRTKAHKRKSETSEEIESKRRRVTDSGSTWEQTTFDASEVRTIAEGEVVPRLSLSAGFSWDDSFKLPETSGGVQESDSDEEMTETEKEKPKQSRKTRQKRKAEEKKDEQRVFEMERRQLDTDRMPETAADFDRLVLQSPDSSLLWLRYMAFHLETSEVDKARAVANKALQSISFREEQEKLNVWVALMNLENMYGSPESLTTVLQRALQHCEPIDVYQQLVSIYRNSGKIEAAEELYKTMVKRFNKNKDVWHSFGLFYFSTQQAELGRKLLQRCLRSLERKDHVDMIAKYAQMEFKFSEPERGRTMFENILSNYPKRCDLWSVYIDMLTKLGDPEPVRQLFERVIQLKVSVKKMKFFFKKYLEFEQRHGTEESVEAVKQKATDYVESKVVT